MKKALTVSVRTGLLTALTLGLTLITVPVRAQTLEDSIESELDKTGGGGEFVDTPAAEPSPEPSAGRVSIAEPPPIDPPNVEFEQRLYRIFQNAQPVSDEKWSELLGSRREDSYRVQPGDTLWDISQTMFGDGFFWSKLWAENSGVENPHRIEKGQAIRFIAGNEDEPPSVSVVKDDFTPTPIKINAMSETSGTKPVYREEAMKDISPEKLRDNTIEVEELVPMPEIPPGKPRRKVVDLPPSFRPPIKPSADKGYDSTGLDAGRVRSLTEPGKIHPTSIILDHNPDGVGQLDEIELGEKFASIGQTVFLRLRRPAHKGEKFSVMKAQGQIEDAKIGTVGPVMELGGTVEILAPVDEGKNTYRAVVTESVNPVRLGSVVLEGPLPVTTYAQRGTLVDSVVRIIGGEFDENRKFVGEGAVVYLGGGTASGLNAGDLLAVRARRGERRDESRYANWSQSIGVLKVVKVERKVATAIVLDAREEIRIGDMTGGRMPEALRPIGNGSGSSSKFSE